jgi:hypothetical protein
LIDLSQLKPQARDARAIRLEEKKILTGRISETSRYISFGILALYYTLRTAKDDFSTAIVVSARGMLTVMALCASLAIIFDYLHYFFAVRSVDNALNERTDQLYDPIRFDFKLREVCYQAKQLLALTSALLLFLAVARSA